MKKSPFSQNSVNKEWAKTVTLEAFIQTHPNVPIEHATTAYYEATGKKFAYHETAEIAEPLNPEHNGISTTTVEEIPTSKRTRSSRTNPNK